jgi:hypothetical protein
MRHSMNSTVSGTFETYYLAKSNAIEAFPQSLMISHVIDGSVRLEHYQTLLLTLFHQTRSSPYTFATAASNCMWRHRTAKEYLLRHALEESNHWEWILDDLKSIGYQATDPQNLFPHVSCEAYIGFNERIANRFPIARLAIAAVLEGIGAEHGGNYGRKLLQALKLAPRNCTFFLSHAETDKEHSVEIDNLLKNCDLDPGEWAWMAHAAETAGKLYRAMYDHQEYA